MAENTKTDELSSIISPMLDTETKLRMVIALACDGSQKPKDYYVSYVMQLINSDVCKLIDGLHYEFSNYSAKHDQPMVHEILTRLEAERDKYPLNKETKQ